MPKNKFTGIFEYFQPRYLPPRECKYRRRQPHPAATAARKVFPLFFSARAAASLEMTSTAQLANSDGPAILISFRHTVNALLLPVDPRQYRSTAAQAVHQHTGRQQGPVF
jgi:hypothetical protein